MKKRKLLIIYCILFNIFLVIFPYITNGQETVIRVYPVSITIIYSLFFLIDILLLKKLKETKLYLITTIAMFLALPLSANAFMLYLLSTIIFLVLNISIKKYRNVILMVLSIIISLCFSLENFLQQNNSTKERINFGYSTNEKHFAYCEIKNKDDKKEYTIMIFRKKPYIAILDSFFADFGQQINVNTCDANKINWINDYEINIDNKIYKID